MDIIPFVSAQEIQGIYEKGGAGENIANFIKYILEAQEDLGAIFSMGGHVQLLLGDSLQEFPDS